MNKLSIIQENKQQKAELESVVAKSIDMAKCYVDCVEVAINKSTGININTRLGETENVEFNSDGALGISVYHNGCKGSVSTNDLSQSAIKNAIEKAVDIMKYTSPDPYSGLADKSLMAFDAPDLDLFHPTDLSVEKAIEQASIAEEAALSYPEITSSDGGYFSSRYGIKVYGNSHGMLQSYCASSHSLSCSVIGKRGELMESNYAYTSSRDICELNSPEWVGQEAAKRTIARLGAKTISTRQVPVLFSAEVAVGLLGHLAGAIGGGAIYRKSSFLLDCLGKQILPDWLSIIDDPHILKGIASSPFDSEGVKTVKREIVTEGILQTYLLSSYSAKKLSTADNPLQSTGHAGGIHNWIVESSHSTKEFNELLSLLDRGVVVTSLMGQGVNSVTGDYSRGAAGFWVENGQIQYPIHEFTIAGNLADIYQRIVALGSDIERRGSIRSGSIMIDKMSIAGK